MKEQGADRLLEIHAGGAAAERAAQVRHVELDLLGQVAGSAGRVGRICLLAALLLQAGLGSQQRQRVKARLDAREPDLGSHLGSATAAVHQLVQVQVLQVKDGLCVRSVIIAGVPLLDLRVTSGTAGRGDWPL